MSELANDLQPNDPKVPAKANNRPGFHNQGNIKAAARGIVLEALTAWKGNKVGKRGLLVRAMAQLEESFLSPEPSVRQWACEQVLKMANGMTKDDKANPLEEMLKGATNVQINFNQHFANRSKPDQPSYSIEISHASPDQEDSAGQALTPPPRPGDRPPSE